MAKEFKSALGSVGPALYDILASIVQTNDLAAAGQIKTFKQIIQLALLAKQQGIELEPFLEILKAFRIERATVASGEIEMSGAASTGLETQEGKALHVDFNAGGVLGPITLGGEFGYQTSNSKATFERSSQNFRILARYAVAPADLTPELMTKLVDFASKATPGVNTPPLPEEFENPSLEMLRDMLPILSEVFKKKEE